MYSTSCCTLIGRDTFLLKLDCVAFFVTTSWELDNMATELKCNNFLVQVLCFGWNTDFLCFDDYINLRHSKNAQKLNIWTAYEFKQLKWNKKLWFCRHRNSLFWVHILVHDQKTSSSLLWILKGTFFSFGLTLNILQEFAQIALFCSKSMSRGGGLLAKLKVS